MNRHERRATASATRKQAAGYPAELAPVHPSRWPSQQPGKAYPEAVWCSREYLVQQYWEPAFQGIEVRRLTVNRVTIGTDGHWDSNITWDELQRIKRETGHGDWYAIEVYPRDRDVVHVANMRHLWLLAEPLPIGWFEGDTPP